MKKYFILFAVGLLACAGQRGIKYDTTDNYLVLGEDVVITLPLNLSESEISQQFDVRVTITFPKMNLQQAAELEARVRKLFPEAQEIDFGLEKEIKAPADIFKGGWLDPFSRTVPGIYPSIELLPHEKQYFYLPHSNLNPNSILQADSTGMPVWREF